MRSRTFPIARRVLAMFAVIMLAGCGSDSTSPSDDGDGGGIGTQAFYAFFLDDAVYGLRYQYEGGPMMTTDRFGACRIMPDVPVTFWVDDVELGTVASPTTRITPNSFGVTGTNIARFVQSVDTTPGEPGIDVSDLDLAPTPINFNQGNDAFAMDAAVQQAVADAATMGGTGVLVTATQASQALSASLSFAFEASDLENRAFFPIVAGDLSELCYVRTFADGTGMSICQVATGAEDGASESFTWSLSNPSLVVNVGADELVTVDPLGTTGNWIATQVTTECLTCNPESGPTIELTAQTFIRPLPISTSDFAGVTLDLTAIDGTITATFNANGTGSFIDGGEVVTFAWSVDDVLEDVLVMRGNGPAGTEMFYGEAFLLEGTVTNGGFASMSGTATDVNNSTIVEDSDVEATGVFDTVELLISGL